MRMNKRKLLVIALCVALAATISLGSLAWFTANDEVTNEFYVADSNTTDAEDIFGIDLWEKDENDVIYNDEDDPNSPDHIVFEEIIAGDHLKKQPFFDNTGIHPMWVRATVTITGADVLKEAIGTYDWGMPEKLLEGISDKWLHESSVYDPATGELTHVFYYADVLDEGATTEQLFEYVNIPTGLTVEQAEALDKFDITILGEAIQSENLNVSSAKAAFDTYWEEATTVGGTGVVTETEYFGDDLSDAELTMDTDSSVAFSNVKFESEDGVDEALLTIENGVYNATIILDGGEFTLQSGDKIIKGENSGAFWVYIVNPITVNGVEVAKADLANYFENVYISVHY